MVAVAKVCLQSSVAGAGGPINRPRHARPQGRLDLLLKNFCQKAGRRTIFSLVMQEYRDVYPEDALHIAVAAVYAVDTIVTWNFKHMNNPATRLLIRRSVEAQGYRCPELCSPDEFLGEDDE